MISISFFAAFSFLAPPCPFCGGELEFDVETTQAGLKGFLDEVGEVSAYGVVTSPDGEGMAFYGRFTCKECNKSLDTYAEHVRAWLVS